MKARCCQPSTSCSARVLALGRSGDPAVLSELIGLLRLPSTRCRGWRPRPSQTGGIRADN